MCTDKYTENETFQSCWPAERWRRRAVASRRRVWLRRTGWRRCQLDGDVAPHTRRQHLTVEAVARCIGQGGKQYEGAVQLVDVDHRLIAVHDQRLLAIPENHMVFGCNGMEHESPNPSQLAAIINPYHRSSSLGSRSSHCSHWHRRARRPPSG